MLFIIVKFTQDLTKFDYSDGFDRYPIDNAIKESNMMMVLVLLNYGFKIIISDK